MESRRFIKAILDSFRDSKSVGRTGALIGFLLAFFWVVVGFWNTLFILILTVAGYVLAIRYFSNKDDFRNLLNRLLPPGKFR